MKEIQTSLKSKHEHILKQSKELQSLKTEIQTIKSSQSEKTHTNKQMLDRVKDECARKISELKRSHAQAIKDSDDALKKKVSQKQ